MTLSLAERHLMSQQLQEEFSGLKKTIATTVISVERKLRANEKELKLSCADTSTPGGSGKVLQ